MILAKFFESWLRNPFPRRRLTPTEGDVKDMQQLHCRVFDTEAGRELIETWLETIVLANPRSTDPNECIAYTVKCAFVEDIVKALDKARQPAKYAEMTQPQVNNFDARKGWGNYAARPGD